MARFPDALNEQIGYEFAASQQYVAIAAYFDAESLPPPEPDSRTR